MAKLTYSERSLIIYGAMKDNIARTKKQIQKETGLTKSQLDRTLRMLRWEKKIGIYKRKYWGLRLWRRS